MNDFSSDMQETQVIDSYTSWFNNNYGITGISEEPASLFDMCSFYPVTDHGSPLEETAYQVQHERRSEHDFCCGGYWGDDLFSGGRYSRDGDGCNVPVVKTEDSSQSEDQYQNYTSYCEDEFSQPDCDYNPWSYQQYCEDEDSYINDGDEPKTTYGYRMDEEGLCEGIFGYFPCLLRQQKEYNNMQ